MGWEWVGGQWAIRVVGVLSVFRAVRVVRAIRVVRAVRVLRVVRAQAIYKESREKDSSHSCLDCTEETSQVWDVLKLFLSFQEGGGTGGVRPWLLTKVMCLLSGLIIDNLKKL